MTDLVEMMLNRLRSDDAKGDPFEDLFEPYEEEYCEDDIYNDFLEEMYDDYRSDYGYLDDEDYF